MVFSYHIYLLVPLANTNGMQRKQCNGARCCVGTWEKEALGTAAVWALQEAARVSNAVSAV